MDYQAAIQQIYDHIDNDRVEQEVMKCIRLSRITKDSFHTAIFLREVYSNKSEFIRAIYDDISQFNQNTQNFLFERSLEIWVQNHTLDSFLEVNDLDEKKNILKYNICEIEYKIEQLQNLIKEKYYSIDINDTQKCSLLVQIDNLLSIKQKIKKCCFQYALFLERQLQSQEKPQTFLIKVQTEVNNYFKARSEEVYRKLLKATKLIESSEIEDHSLLLTQVRRVIKAAADYFYEPTTEKVICSDGKKRLLGNEQYLNRLQEFICSKFNKSSSKDLISAELESLSLLVRRLNDLASKGVHSDVSLQEAKQGLIGIYFFLHNLILILEKE